MARCVEINVLDTDAPEHEQVPERACAVHTHMAPCPRDGQPASSAAMHSDLEPGRERVLADWWHKTRGQRPIVLHQGSWLDDHEMSAACRCDPEVVLASPEPITLAQLGQLMRCGRLLG